MRLLAAALALFVALAPLPFGSVHPAGRLVFEGGAYLLGLGLAVVAARRRVAWPPRLTVLAAAGLLALALLQALPLGPGIVGIVSPASAEAHRSAAAPRDVEEREARLLGTDPATFDRPAAISVDPPSTASALRTGGAYLAILLVAAAVAGSRGARPVALGLLLGGAFQALYGILVLASGHDRIWGIPKVAYLDSATGTFVNRNNYAAYLAIALSAGAGLALAEARAAFARRAPGGALAALSAPRAGRAAILTLLTAIVAAGLLVSFSRAGTAVGILALAATFLASGFPARRRTRVAVLALLVAFASVPLLDLGASRLAERYARSEAELLAPGARVTVWGDTLRLAGRFPVFGSGLGAFSTAYPPFRSPEVRVHYTHAHNDWAQAAAEGGGVGVLLVLLGAVPIVLAIPRALSGRAGPLAAGLASGLLAFGAHAVVDFPARIPAVVAAALAAAGGLLVPPRGDDEPAAGPRPLEARPAPTHPGPGIALGAGLVAAALAATALSADLARDASRPWREARSAAERAIAVGPEAPEVRRTLLALRERLGARPLDADARAAYAAVLVETAFGTEDTEAAAFHARAALATSPVSRPVVATSADVLLRAGHPEEALAAIRAMFGWDPREGARLLARAEALLGSVAVERGLGQTPEAYRAFAALRLAEGRRPDGRRLLEEAAARWPEDAPTRAALADEALSRRDLESFRALVPVDLPVPDPVAGAILLVHRARAKGLAGDPAGARLDAEAAARAAAESPWILLRAGDALEATGDVSGARRLYARALHAAPRGPDPRGRVAALVRLARLDEREGRAGEAYRGWREVLALEPENREASSRVQRLHGGREPVDR